MAEGSEEQQRIYFWKLYGEHKSFFLHPGPTPGIFPTMLENLEADPKGWPRGTTRCKGVDFFRASYGRWL